MGTTDESGEFTVRFIDLPASIEAMVILDTEGHANIYVNSCISFEARRRVIKHELAHVRRDDVHSERDIRDVEREL